MLGIAPPLLMSTMGSPVDPQYERHGTSTIPTGVPVPLPPYGLIRSVIESVTAGNMEKDRLPRDSYIKEPELKFNIYWSTRVCNEE
jgi:hypothetical protein